MRETNIASIIPQLPYINWPALLDMIGEASNVPDLAKIQVDYPRGRRATDVLIATWSFSHALFLLALPSQRSESVLAGMVAALEFFGCVAREVWWDNPKTIATITVQSLHIGY